MSINAVETANTHNGINARFVGIKNATAPAIKQLNPINARKNDGVNISPMTSIIPVIIQISHIFSMMFPYIKK